MEDLLRDDKLYFLTRCPLGELPLH